MLDLKQVPRIDLEALHTFVVVAHLHSFSAAAELLHKTTSAISYRIKTLEDSMGVVLVERTTRSVHLTPSGEMLLEKAIQMFEWHQSIPEELKQIRDGIEPHFTLVVNNLLYDSHAAAILLAYLHERYPHTAFKLQKSVYMGVWDAMQYGGGQLAIGAPGIDTISDEFRAERAGIIHWVPVASVSHPIARESAPVTIDMLRRYPVINIEDTSLRMQKRLPWRLIGQQELIVPDMATKIDSHAAGLGVGFLPLPLAREAIAQRKLVEIPLAAEYRQPSPLALVWRIKGAGKISEHLQELFHRRDPLITPFLRALSAPGDEAPGIPSSSPV